MDITMEWMYCSTTTNLLMIHLWVHFLTGLKSLRSLLSTSVPKSTTKKCPTANSLNNWNGCRTEPLQMMSIHPLSDDVPNRTRSLSHAMFMAGIFYNAVISWLEARLCDAGEWVRGRELFICRINSNLVGGRGDDESEWLATASVCCRHQQWCQWACEELKRD